MREIIRFLMDNPLVLVILVAWIAGALGNMVKAMKKARERATTSQPMRVEPPVAARVPHRAEPARQPQPIREEEIAQEMRRILRQQSEPTAGDAQAAPQHPERQHPVKRQPEAPPPLPSARPPAKRARNVVLPERPPAPVMPSARRLAVHVDPHVGEGIARRSSVRSGHVGERALGQLGGRVHETARRRTAASRYALDDLKRVIVLNEILGLPLALRGSGGGRDV